jgi:hypothetical protein
MFKLYLSTIDYETIAPLNLNNGSIYDVELTTGISTAYKLKLKFNTQLNQLYNTFVNNLELKLVLEIDKQRFGFSRAGSLITHVLPIGTLTQGSQDSTSFSVDNTVDVNSTLRLSNETVNIGETNYNYLYNPDFITQKKYYSIQQFDYNNNRSVSDEEIPLSLAKQRIYEQSNDWFRQKHKNIEDLTQYQNGTCEITFISSSYDMVSNLRTLPINYEANTVLESFVSEIDDNISLELINENQRQITCPTGILDNYKILNKLIETNENLDWVEVGLIRIDGKLKTKIQIGNFNILNSVYKASNNLFDDVFDNKNVKIAEINKVKNSYNIDFKSSKYIQAGYKIKVDYDEFTETEEGQKIKTISIHENQIFQGYSDYNITNFNNNIYGDN